MFAHLVYLQHPLLVVAGDQETNRWRAEKSICPCDMLKVPHLVSLPQKRQLIAVDGALHHMDVIVLNTEI